MTPAELRQYARKGAEARIAELERELRAIHAAFPALRAGRQVARDGAASTAGPKRRRRRMSREARKRIGDAQRKRWAELREKQAAGAATGTKQLAPKPMAAGSRKKR